MSRHLCLGDLALHDPSKVGLPPVLEGRVGPILERLDEAAAEADCHCGTGQPLRLELLQVVQQVRTRASEDQWMVAPGYDERLATWCGLTLGRVLQVKVAA
jgi:hypothetical protein